MWVYFLKKKSDAFPIFQKFKALVEKEFGSSILTLRFDNGGEFCSSAFSTFCATHGIKRQFTTSHTPQQNGVVEHRNRTITEMARAMMEHRNVPKKYWVEAVFIAIYLLIWSPTHAVKHKTPEEAWSGRKPRINHLKVFDSLPYVWIPDAKRTKLDSKSQKLMFTGYSDTHKAYRLIDVNTDRLIFSCDVVFDEELGPFQLSSSLPHSETQSLETFDLGLPISCDSLDERDDADALLELPPDNATLALVLDPDPLPHPAFPSASNIDFSTLRPKWWAKTINDLRLDELIEGRTSRNKSIQHNTVNVALMANIHSISEPRIYAEAKGIPEWE